MKMVYLPLPFLNINDWRKVQSVYTREREGKRGRERRVPIKNDDTITEYQKIHLAP